ncbi:early transcribed membrane protein [Plasmodium ovale wallikeri]|uniref:Early transcribed membrane protein n=2 Tax=Plasmodium ovale TaxID=36330 RepID=A0A1C3L4C7_PLAOA|nr:early transcribed membrane protein [Plasmodium ovale wallikeri]SBT82189.1 early transcribed membrane protein [Plasmodium ovale]
MNISKTISLFYLLCLSAKLTPYLCKKTDTIEKKLTSLKSIDDVINGKKKKSKFYYALISSGIFVAAAAVLGIGYYISEKEGGYFEDTLLWLKDKRFRFKNPRDGQFPSTSKYYVEPEGINKVNIKGPLVENTNETDVSIKRFNAFVDNARIAIRHNFNNLSEAQRSSCVNDRDYMRKVVQRLQERRNISLSRAQEDIAVLNMESFLHKIYNNKLDDD